MVLAGVLLLLYGFWADLMSLAFSPGGHDAFVDPGVEAIPWYGLSSGGTLAAVVALGLLVKHRLRAASVTLLIALASFGGWTAIMLSG